MKIEHVSPYPNDGFQGDDSYSGLRLEVFSQFQAKAYEPGEDEVCISISTKQWGEYRPNLHPNFVEILRLDFDDIAMGDADNPNATTITRRQARQVAHFVIKHLHKNKLVIHCFAGISRSRSMAAAIADSFQLPYNFTVNNPSVYKAIQEALADVGAELDG